MTFTFPFFSFLLLHRVFKKSSSNGKITVYLGKRDFVDHITHVDPIGEFLFSFIILGLNVIILKFLVLLI